MFFLTRLLSCTANGAAPGGKREIPQETAVFCQVDDMMYSALSRAEFLYTQQIGRGGTMCDYTFRKR